MTYALGLNRRNDTPIGSKPEFRGNMSDAQWNVEDVPAWDGEKFSPSTTTGLLTGYGGLTSEISTGHIADGSPLDDWTVVTPLLGTPNQVIPKPITGFVEIPVAGVYKIDFNCDLANLANGQRYLLHLAVDGLSTLYGAVIDGSNQVSTQSASFSLLVESARDSTISIVVDNAGNNTYDVISASLNVTRVG